MRAALSVLLLVHGVAHLPGFAVAWRLMSSAELPYRTTIFMGRVDVGDTGARALGAVWLVLAGAFAWLSWLNWGGGALFRPVALSIVAVSSLMCVAAWPEARLGLAANALVLLMMVYLAYAVSN
jgi:hypothetical protein